VDEGKADNEATAAPDKGQVDAEDGGDQPCNANQAMDITDNLE